MNADVFIERRTVPFPLDTPCYDSRIAVTTPVQLFLGTGMNAIAHCVEAICSVKAQPFSEALALGGLRTLVKALAACAAAPAGTKAREQAQIGAALSGIAYTNTRLGIAHALVQALGARDTAWRRDSCTRSCSPMR